MEVCSGGSEGKGQGQTMGAINSGRTARFWRHALIAVVLCGAAAFAGYHLRAWLHYRAALASLERYHFAEAREHLAVSLQAWPSSCRAHLLAARAARLDGDFAQAEQHLQICQQASPTDPDGLLEWALLRAQTGELAPVEKYLQDRLRQGAELSPPWIQEALIEGYIKTYRRSPAKAGIEDWLQRQPDDTQALFLEGCLWLQTQQPHMAQDSLRRALELDADRDDVRWRLAQCLVKLGSYIKADPILEYLHRRYPKNAEMTVALAGARYAQGQLPQARQLLDDVLAEQPDNEAALRERGRIALKVENAAEAEKWLRRADQLNPHDIGMLQLLSSALEQQGKQDEARIFQERHKQTDGDFKRLEQISLHELEARPKDPVLHSEFGALLLRLGFREAGLNWLRLALSEDQNCAAARAALESATQNKSTAVAR
jgi:tetratricopeptide (TPR) repeat protein